MFGSTIILCLGEEERHAHVCPCCLHLLDESVGGLTGRANVIYQQHPLTLEVVAVYLHVALRLLAVLAAYMHLFALSDHLDMLKAVDGIALERALLTSFVAQWVANLCPALNPSRNRSVSCVSKFALRMYRCGT